MPSLCFFNFSSFFKILFHFYFFIYIFIIFKIDYYNISFIYFFVFDINKLYFLDVFIKIKIICS